ncbi:MAG TPA: hypothetical protein VGN37_06650 [Actinocatenispora sp.]
MTDSERRTSRGPEVRDLGVWSALSAIGLAAVLLGARHASLGTHAAPFLGRYRFAPSPWLVAAALVAAAVLVLAWRTRAATPPFGLVQAVSYAAALAWALTLTAGTGLAARTPAATGPPLAYLREFVGRHAAETHGHPPGAALVVWALREAGLPVALTVTVLGALAVPLTLAAVRNVCGDAPARRYAPVLALAPYLLFLGGGVDGIAAALGAGMVAAGARASDRRRTGWPATGWALVSGLLLGVAALTSYAVVWLGVSVVLLYFARRRAFLNLATGLGALAVPVVAATLGFSWPAGLLAAHAGFTSRPVSAFWWGPVSLVTLLLAAGPPLVASMRKLRNTPGWPCLVGAGLAVAFSILVGFASGGTEDAWLPFFGWLTIAATAPERQAGPPVPAPLLLTAVGAATALVLAAVLGPP